MKDSEASVLGLRPLGLMNVPSLPQWGLGGGGRSLSGLSFLFFFVKKKSYSSAVDISERVARRTTCFGVIRRCSSSSMDAPIAV